MLKKVTKELNKLITNVNNELAKYTDPPDSFGDRVSVVSIIDIYVSKTSTSVGSYPNGAQAEQYRVIIQTSSGNFQVDNIAGYCGAYNLNMFSGYDSESSLLKSLLVALFFNAVINNWYDLHEDEKDGPPNRLLVWDEPKICIYDTLDSSKLEPLKNKSQFVDLGENNNSGNITGVWYLDSNKLEDVIKDIKSKLALVKPKPPTPKVKRAVLI